MENLLFAGFMAPSIICTIDNTHTIYLLNTTELDLMGENESDLAYRQKKITQKITNNLMFQTFAIKNERIMENKK
jgi:hypothetical protein